ncbi:hypothetical protein F5884DRAFT_108563 [Xylogone sp. PMI_703]|nr:hypothetical protein F5884DRAFT_108563 [Xylogone sp. PMI_703]
MSTSPEHDAGPLQSPQSNPPKAKRSRNGCTHCRARRIKCDEKQPVCGLCSRLNLDCYKPDPPLPLRLRRRGYGSIRSRNKSMWDPPIILPNIQQQASPTLHSNHSIAGGNEGALPRANLLDTVQEIDAAGSTQNLSVTSLVTQNSNLSEELFSSTSTDGIVEDLIATGSLQEPYAPPTPLFSQLHTLFGDAFDVMISSQEENAQTGMDDNSFQIDPGSTLAFPALSPKGIDITTPPSRLLDDIGTSSICASPTAMDAVSSNTLFYPTSKSLSSVQLISSLTPHPQYDLPEALNLGGVEKTALGYYRSQFSDFRTLKGFSWSAYSIFLGVAIEHELILHLILAVSLQGLSRQMSDQSISRLGKQHLQTGLDLLQRSLAQDDPDHLSIMISFWLLVLFTMDNNAFTTGVQRRELSARIYNYIYTHQLDKLCGNLMSDNVLVSETSIDQESRASRSLVCKLISMLVYADVQLNFNTHGGALSEFLLDRARFSRVRQISRNFLELNHGKEYPLSELVYDVESTECYNLYYEQHRIYHLLNQLFWYEIGDYDNIKQEISDLEARYSSFFAIAHRDAANGSYSRLNFQIDTTVCEFYAIRLYLFRCQDDQMPDNYIRDSISSFLQIAHRMQRMKVRYSWFDRSLFLVGAETHDAIHWEWIHNRIIRTDMKTALVRVRDYERIYGRRLRREDIQAILRGAAVELDDRVATPRTNDIGAYPS